MHVSIKSWQKVKPNLKFAALKVADFWVGFGLRLFCLGVLVCLGVLNLERWGGGGCSSLKSDKIWFHGNADLENQGLGGEGKDCKGRNRWHLSTSLPADD